MPCIPLVLSNPTSPIIEEIPIDEHKKGSQLNQCVPERPERHTMVNLKMANRKKIESQSKGNLDPKWPQPYFVSRFIELKNITKPIQNKKRFGTQTYPKEKRPGTLIDIINIIDVIDIHQKKSMFLS